MRQQSVTCVGRAQRFFFTYFTEIKRGHLLTATGTNQQRFTSENRLRTKYMKLEYSSMLRWQARHQYMTFNAGFRCIQQLFEASAIYCIAYSGDKKAKTDSESEGEQSASRLTRLQMMFCFGFNRPKINAGL